MLQCRIPAEFSHWFVTIGVNRRENVRFMNNYDPREFRASRISEYLD